MLMNPSHVNTQIENCSSQRSEKIHQGNIYLHIEMMYAFVLAIFE